MSRNVETLTGGESVPRCCNCLYIRRSCPAPGLGSVEGVARRVEEVPPALHAHDRLEQILVVGFAMDRIDRGRVDDQQRRLVELVEEFRVRLAESLEILLIDQ